MVPSWQNPTCSNAGLPSSRMASLSGRCTLRKLQVPEHAPAYGLALWELAHPLPILRMQQCALRSHTTHPLDDIGCAAAPGRRRGRPLRGRLIWRPLFLDLIPALRRARASQSL